MPAGETQRAIPQVGHPIGWAKSRGEEANVRKGIAALLSLLLVVAVLLTACGPTPEPVIEEKLVTQVVKETVDLFVKILSTKFTHIFSKYFFTFSSLKNSCSISLQQ